MTIYRTTRLADAVLALFEHLVDNEEKNFHLDPYCNGRERGWCITVFKNKAKNKIKQVVFSEFRNTDEIVVYCGKVGDFTMAGNVPSDKVYDNKTFFNYKDVLGAVLFIQKYLEEK